MKIEDITRERLEAVKDIEYLYMLRTRFLNIYDTHFKNNEIRKAKSINLGRRYMLRKYVLLRSELKRRGRDYHPYESPLDNEVYEELFMKSIWNLDVPSLGDLVVVPEYVSIGGSFIKSPKDAEDVDIIIREDDDSRDESLELKLGRVVREQTKKEPHFVYSQRGPHSTYIPLFDLVLRAREETKKVKVKEAKKSAEAKMSAMRERAYFESLDDWDAAYKKDNAEVIKALAEGSVLDLGCGACRLLKMLKDEGREVKGTDISNVALGICKHREIDVRKVDLEKDDLPFKDNSFDNVICVHTIEHLEFPEKLIKDACTVAKKKVIILSPLGERLDPSHKQEFKTINDFKQYFGRQWTVREIEETNTAIAVREFEGIGKVALKPFGRFIPPKPTMAGLTEAFSVEEIWNWAKDKFPLDVEEKLNGFRFILEKAGDRIRLKTEGDKDRTKQLPELAKALKKIPNDFIADCSMGIERNGKALPRIKLMTLMADRPELEEGDVVKATLFDLPYWKEDLHEKPLSERRKSLEAFYNKYLKGDPHFSLTHYTIVKDRAELERQFRKLAELPQSEGIMIKTLDGIWDTDGSAETWAKIKREAEIKVIALERHGVKGGLYNYTCGLLPGDSAFENLTEFRGEKYVDLGKCFNTKIKAEPGDILTMGVEEIIPQEKELDWLGARVLDVDKDRKTPYFANQAIDIAERAGILQKAVEAGIDYKVGDKGKGVLQLHIMGIEEEKIAALKKRSQEAVRARHNPAMLKMLLKSAIGEQGAHIDLRLVKTGDDFFEGGEIMIGNLTGLGKIKKLDVGGKLRFGWKVPRVEEPEAETIRGPVSWMEAGKGRVEIFPPGEVGATAHKYGAMILLDSFDWEAIEPQDKHAKKFEFKGNKFIPEGTYLMAYVPVAPGERVWMISKLKEEEEEKGHRKKVEKGTMFRIVKIDRKKQIVGGVVYEPHEVDTQNDYTDEKEIEKAMHRFMEKYATNSNRIRINHKGKKYFFPILECFQPEVDTIKGDQPLKKGSWWLQIHITNNAIWKAVEDGSLTGFSMGGRAKA